jgi:hypothetical protein
MPEDFGYAWRTVRLYCPSAPTFLAREWVQAAWKQLLASRRWGFMRAELTLPVLDTDLYAVMPADFASFKVVVDQARQVRLSYWHSLDELRLVDPALSATGQPSALVASTPSTDPATLGRARYQLYPHGSAATLTAIYHRQGDRLIDTDIFTGVLADGAEVLVAGALAQAALWPGTGEKPNPYFNATLAQTKTNEFKYGVQMLALRDDEQYPDDLWDSWMVADCGLGAWADPRSTDASACCC